MKKIILLVFCLMLATGVASAAPPAVINTDAPLSYRFKLWIPATGNNSGYYTYLNVSLSPTGLNKGFASPEVEPAISSSPLKAISQ